MKNFIPILKYINLTLKHKIYVYQAGRKLKLGRWQLLIHDLSKFSIEEAPHYGRQFFGNKDDEQGFATAWLHHQNVNKHHWEYWIARTGHSKGDSGDNKPLFMPEKYVREMVADWLGAGKAYEGKSPKTFKEWQWVQDNLPKILPNMHQKSQTILFMVFFEYFKMSHLYGYHQKFQGYDDEDGVYYDYYHNEFHRWLGKQAKKFSFEPIYSQLIGLP